MGLFPMAQGFILGASMIIPIGAQNAFILNQGIKRQFHLTAASICMLCDMGLILVGIYGGSQIIASSELAFTVLTWFGILFLFGYGLISFKAVMKNSHSESEPIIEQSTPQRVMSSLPKVMATCLAVTLLNPHAYIDTVVILGGVGGQFTGEKKFNFALGCMLASIVWFYGLALLAAKMSFQLSQPRVKKVIDIIVGIMMWVIAVSLFLSWY
jgi:L-lysine exporter family protein LysE/ArgO